MLTEFNTSSPQAVRRWSQRLTRETIGRTYLRRFMGTSNRAIIQLHTDLRQGRGDEVKFDLLVQLAGYGVHGDTRLKGREKKLTYYQDSLGIDQLREAVAYTTMSQQRTLHQLRRDGTENLADLFARVYDETLLAHLAGDAGSNTELNTEMDGFGGNSFAAVDSAHDMDRTSATMSVSFLTAAKAKAKVLNPMLRPARFQGQDWYVFLGHPYSIAQMRLETGPTKWAEVQARAGERGRRNPLFTGAVGVWDGVVIHESEFVPYNTSTNVAYNLFLGAQSGHIGFGNPYTTLGRKPSSTNELFSWFEEGDDYGNETGVAGGSIFGLKAAEYNSERFGMIRIRSQDADPTA